MKVAFELAHLKEFYKLICYTNEMSLPSMYKEVIAQAPWAAPSESAPVERGFWQPS